MESAIQLFYLNHGRNSHLTGRTEYGETKWPDNEESFDELLDIAVYYADHMSDMIVLYPTKTGGMK